MCLKSSVSTPPHASVAPLQRLLRTEGTPHYTSINSVRSPKSPVQDSKEKQGKLHKMVLLSCLLSLFFPLKCLVFIERKPGILTKITTQTNRKQHIRMPNTQHLLSWAPGWQRRWCLKFYFSNTQDLAVSVSSSLFHVKIKSSYCSFIVKQSSSSPQPKSEPTKIHECLFSDFLAMYIA